MIRQMFAQLSADACWNEDSQRELLLEYLEKHAEPTDFNDYLTAKYEFEMGIERVVVIGADADGAVSLHTALLQHDDVVGESPDYEFLRQRAIDEAEDAGLKGPFHTVGGWEEDHVRRPFAALRYTS